MRHGFLYCSLILLLAARPLLAADSDPGICFLHLKVKDGVFTLVSSKTVPGTLKAKRAQPVQQQLLMAVESATGDPVPTSNDSEEPVVPPNGDVNDYVPYQPALDSGISEEMDRVNFRRLQLVNRKFLGQLTPEEATELEQLQKTFFTYVETVFPRASILDDDRLEKLEAKYKDAEKS